MTKSRATGLRVRVLGRSSERRPFFIATGTLICWLGALVVFLVFTVKPWELPTGPGFFAETRHRQPGETIRIGLYWAAALNAILCALLLATARWWTAPLGAAAREPGEELGSRPARGRPTFWVLVALAMLLGLALRWPLAHGSLWWDEGWSVRMVVVGRYVAETDQPDVREWRSYSIRRPLWYFKKPTNHVLYNVAAYGSHGVWKTLHGGERHEFDEFVFRLPAISAALLSILLLALLVRSWGFPRAAVMAAFLLAIHPWHIRYGVDGRAYSFVVLFTLTSCLALTQLLRSGAWRAHGLYGISQLCLLWSFPYAIFLTGSLGMAGLVGVVTSHRSASDRRRLAARFIVTHLAAGGLLLQVIAPNLTKVPLWEYSRPVSAASVTELWSGLATGIPARGREEEFAQGFPNLRSLSERSAWVGPVAFGLLPALSAIGFLGLVRRGHAARVVSVGLLASGPLSLALTIALGQQFYPRYLIFLLPGVLAWLAISVELGLRPLERVAGRTATVLTTVLVLGAYQALVLPQTQLLLRNPYAPMRDVVEFLAAVPASDAAPPLRAGYGLGGGMPAIYDPGIRPVSTPLEIEALCREAVESERPLYLFYAYPRTNERRRPTGLGMIRDSGSFQQVAEFHGIEAQFHYRVFRHNGGACPAP